MDSTIGNVLRAKRREQKLTLRQLSEKTGIDYSMLSKYENGLVIPPEEKLQTIAAALNIEEDKILSEKQISTLDLSVIRRSVFSNINDDQYVISESAAGRFVLEAANNTCELCGTKFPEINGFLEIHNVIWLRDGGTPTIDNTVALCPNCHKMIHLCGKPDDTEKLLAIAKRHKYK